MVPSQWNSPGVYSSWVDIILFYGLSPQFWTIPRFTFWVAWPLWSDKKSPLTADIPMISREIPLYPMVFTAFPCPSIIDNLARNHCLGIMLPLNILFLLVNAWFVWLLLVIWLILSRCIPYFVAFIPPSLIAISLFEQKAITSFLLEIPMFWWLNPKLLLVFHKFCKSNHMFPNCLH